MLCSLYTILKSVMILTPFFQLYNNAILNGTQFVGVEVVYKSVGEDNSFLISKHPDVHACFNKNRYTPKRHNRYLYCIKSPLHLPSGTWSAVQVKTSLKPTVVESCSDACRSGYRYFGIDSGTTCWCSRSLPLARPVPNSLCLPCFDKKEKSCGNVNYGMTSLYQVLYSSVKPASPETFLKKNPTFKERIISSDQFTTRPTESIARRKVITPSSPTNHSVVTVQPTRSPTNHSVVTVQPTSSPTNHSVVTVQPTSSPTNHSIVTPLSTSSPTNHSVVTPLPTSSLANHSVVTVQPTSSLANHSVVTLTNYTLDSIANSSTVTNPTLIRVKPTKAYLSGETPVERMLDILEHRAETIGKQDRFIKSLIIKVIESSDEGDNRDKDEEDE